MGLLQKVFSSGAGKLIKDVGGVLDDLTTSKEEKLLQLVLITVIGAYFGGRSLEKTKIK
jgi:hypothetical protein